ncbi:MAG: CCA tRNA nucleotidyltransferase [Rhodospirillales bacterium]|nr:CCA tRNA nucleotidyltransferase [Rhodospirillales bacterium]
MKAPATRAVLAALEAGGQKARFVGGCVRDALLGRPIGDIDIATPEPPERVVELLHQRGIKAVPTGIEHGTVTAVARGKPFEITTLRRDVETFGRHARVAFDADWAEDARRRDFTMNALFLDATGAVFDTVGGLEDLRAGRVRFVGDPETRIREDVLRLLRFYRFHAHYGRGAADEAARAACRRLAPLLPTLSAERIAAELVKLLRAPDPVPTFRLMEEDGVLAAALPELGRIDLLARLVAIEPEPDPLRRLAALLPPDAAAAEAFAARLRFSNDMRDRLVALAKATVDLDADERAQRKAIYQLGPELYRDAVLLSAASAGKERPDALLELAAKWPVFVFPLRGRDLVAAGIPPGKEVGRLLETLRSWWEANDFAPDRAACLAELERLRGASDESGEGG